jgi:hypothetical protein
MASNLRKAAAAILFIATAVVIYLTKLSEFSDAVYLNLATQNHPQEQGKIAWAGGNLSLGLSAPTAT